MASSTEELWAAIVRWRNQEIDPEDLEEALLSALRTARNEALEEASRAGYAVGCVTMGCDRTVLATIRSLKEDT